MQLVFVDMNNSISAYSGMIIIHNLLIVLAGAISPL